MSRVPAGFVSLFNGQTVNLDQIRLLTLEDFQQSIVWAVSAGCRVSALFASQGQTTSQIQLYAILADDFSNCLYVGSALLANQTAPSLTPNCPQVHLFEREIAEQFGIKWTGHPCFKPVRFCRSWTGMDAWDRTFSSPILPADWSFYQIDSNQTHEVAVGPVHAGIIEPGHFRFQCYGEHVFHLEIMLGYQHRGVEEALIGGPTPRSIHYAQTVAGDTTVGHTTAYCQIVEALSDCSEPPRSQALRAIMLELERLANHIGDLGALANDVGFLPTASYCGRIRGDALNLTALICGNRFGRRMLQPGGVAFDVESERIQTLCSRLDRLKKDITTAVNLLWETPSVMARFEHTGGLTKQAAIQLGLVGPAARACGVSRDVRHDHPAGLFRFVYVPVSSYESGDVFGRAFVRWLEIQQSIAFIEQQIKMLPSGVIAVPIGALRPNRLAVSLVEGWRGEICHAAITNADGRFSRYKIVDPSFHNWPGLAMALRDQQISDFPLCNKSFNLSYCGFDL